MSTIQTAKNNESNHIQTSKISQAIEIILSSLDTKSIATLKLISPKINSDDKADIIYYSVFEIFLETIEQDKNLLGKITSLNLPIDMDPKLIKLIFSIKEIEDNPNLTLYAYLSEIITKDLENKFNDPKQYLYDFLSNNQDLRDKILSNSQCHQTKRDVYQYIANNREAEISLYLLSYEKCRDKIVSDYIIINETKNHVMLNYIIESFDMNDKKSNANTILDTISTFQMELKDNTINTNSDNFTSNIDKVYKTSNENSHSIIATDITHAKSIDNSINSLTSDIDQVMDKILSLTNAKTMAALKYISPYIDQNKVRTIYYGIFEIFLNNIEDGTKLLNNLIHTNLWKIKCKNYPTIKIDPCLSQRIFNSNNKVTYQNNIKIKFYSQLTDNMAEFLKNKFNKPIEYLYTYLCKNKDIMDEISSIKYLSDIDTECPLIKIVMHNYIVNDYEAEISLYLIAFEDNRYCTIVKKKIDQTIIDSGLMYMIEYIYAIKDKIYTNELFNKELVKNAKFYNRLKIIFFTCIISFVLSLVYILKNKKYNKSNKVVDNKDQDKDKKQIKNKQK